MFILGLPLDEIKFAIDTKDYKILSDKLYRVQKLGSSDYTFRHHLETQIIDDKNAQLCNRFFRVNSLKALFELQPCKVKIDRVGTISL